MVTELVMNNITSCMTPMHTYWYEAWLTVDGNAVAYAKVSEQPTYDGIRCICTLTNPEECQKQGYAETILELVSQKLGKLTVLDGHEVTATAELVAA